MILLVDNYDSFTYNLAQYLGTFTEVKVLRNDDETLYEEAEKADGLVFSPGPGWPADAGKMEALIKDFAGKKPMMGIWGTRLLRKLLVVNLAWLRMSCMANKAILLLKRHRQFSRILTMMSQSCVTIPSLLTKCQRALM